MAILLAIPILGALTLLQSAIASRITLLNGAADLVLVAIIAWALQRKVETAWHWAVIGGFLINIPSNMPLGVPLAGYLAVTGLALALKRRVWRAALLAMLVATTLGSLLALTIDWAALLFFGTPLPVVDSFIQVILPSTLINLLLAVPFYALANELAARLYPDELEI